MADSASMLDEPPVAPSAQAGPEPAHAGGGARPVRLAGTELLELIADGVVSTDEEGRIILFNRAAEELFGYGRDEILGRPVDILLPERARGAHREALAAFAGSPAGGYRIMGQGREVTGRRKSGKEFAAEASLSRRRAGGRMILTAVIRDISARRRAEEQQLILSRELAHRFKNMMAVITSIISLTARSAPSKEALVVSLRGRLETLARAQERLLESETRSADLRSLIEGEISPYRARSGANFRLIGEPCVIGPGQVANLALALHELATNAAKYGALSCATGRVTIEWSMADGSLLLSWREAGGPPPRKPAGDGFGTELIRRLLGSGVQFEYASEGLKVSARIRLGG